jgi:prephenate dehydrogenase
VNTFSSVEVIGGGLIGTSIALKLAKNGSQVRVVDSNAAHAKVANSLIGSSLLAENAPIECVVVATPVEALAEVIVSALISNPKCIVIDIGSIKTKVILDVWTLTESMSNKVELRERYIPTHPMAGREVSGPDGARSDLFEGRAWAITPHSQSKEPTLNRVEALVREFGAVVYRMSPEEHDRQVAMTSHLPQLLASLLASVLKSPLDLAGQGLRDMTRLAHSNPAMWAPIVQGNRSELEPLLNEIIKSINDLKDKLFEKRLYL